MTEYFTGDAGTTGGLEHGYEHGSPTGDDLMRRFERSAVMGDINVTPMVDVMLVLLIIFMVVTPALVAGFNAQLPQGIHLKERPEEEQRTTLGIDGAGAYYLDTQPIAECTAEARATEAGRQRCDARLRPLLAAEYRAHPQDRVLFIKADRRLKYREIVDVMRLAKESGARVIAAVTEARGQPEDDERS